MSRTFATYVVSGAGMTNIDGRYVPSGNNEFTLESGKFTIWNDGIYWFIMSNEDFTNPYKTTDNPATPDLGTWVKVQAGGGIDPPPTVVAGTPLPANPDILVSGAGSDLVNGTYEHTDFVEGKPMYTKGSERYRIANYDLWFILAPYTHPEWGDIDLPYYQEKQSESGSPATPDLVAEWEIYTDEGLPTTGVNPPPNVTEYTPDPPHDIAVDPLTATAGITEPTLTQTHIINVDPLSASAGLTEPTLTQTHIINIEPLGMVANLTDIDFAQTHVIDIEPLWAQIELSDLTLAVIKQPTPDCRTYFIDAENRTLIIGSEDRTHTIDAENRTLEVRCH